MPYILALYDIMAQCLIHPKDKLMPLLESMRTLCEIWSIWNDNSKMDIRNTGCDAVGWV